MSSVTILQYDVSWSYVKNVEKKSQEFELWSLQSQDSDFRYKATPSLWSVTVI